MKTIHFVYVLPNRKNYFGRIFRKIFHRELFRRGSIESFSWPSPMRAPQSITFFVGKWLESHFNVKFYHLTERLAISPNQGDILLGHLWTDRHSIMWNSIKDARFSKKILIQPYNNSKAQLGWVAGGLELCDGFIAIGGDYWFDNIKESPLKNFEDKIFPINMAVEESDYPVVKKKFNPINKRRFLYIGRQSSFGDEKGITMLEGLASVIPGFQGGYICAGGEIKGWKKISDPTALTPIAMKSIAEDYDIFINMSRSDAQATTILEAMGWGFPIACTNESGYSHEKDFFYLSLDNMNHNINTIKYIQNLSNEHLELISLNNRKVLITKYSWQSFASKFEKYIRSFL